MKRVLLCIIFIFLTTHSESSQRELEEKLSNFFGVIGTQIETLLESNKRIDDRTQDIQRDLTAVMSRVSALESWREQQQISSARFYQVNWTASEQRLTKIEQGQTKQQEEMSELRRIQQSSDSRMETIVLMFGGAATLILIATPFMLRVMDRKRIDHDPLRQSLSQIAKNLSSIKDGLSNE